MAQQVLSEPQFQDWPEAGNHLDAASFPQVPVIDPYIRSLNEQSFQRNTAKPFSAGSKSKKRRMTTSHVRVGKCWPSKFKQRRICNDSSFYRARVQGREDLRAADDDAVASISASPLTKERLLDTLLEDEEGVIPSWKAKVMRVYFDQSAQNSQDAQDSRFWAWLDDRELSASEPRESLGELTSSDLRNKLLKPCNYVDRRLIYISKLTPDFILAVSETVRDHQVDAWRDAVCKHITSQISFAVKIPMNGFTTFSMEFHLPYLILREDEIDQASPADQTNSSTTSVASLSFLQAENHTTSLNVFEASVSVVVCGWSDTQWTGWAFVRTGLDPLPFPEQYEDGPQQDLFAADRDDDYVSDAGAPTWNARSYWLQIVGIRCQLILKEWSYLVHTVEGLVEAWMIQETDNTSGIGNQVITDKIKSSLDSTLQAMQLLRKLKDRVSATLRAYSRFSATNGDKNYFADMEADTRLVQNSIEESFENLTDLHLRLVSLDRSCTRFTSHLGRVLNLESNRLTLQSNTLNQESNLLTVQNLDLSKQTQELGILTNEVNEKIRKLNEESTDAVRASQETAAKTSHSTRINIELLLLTTPFAMVLQYFGSEIDIFAFNRNPKTFVVATIVLMVILRLLTILLENWGRLAQILPGRGFWSPAMSRAGSGLARASSVSSA